MKSAVANANAIVLSNETSLSITENNVMPLRPHAPSMHIPPLRDCVQHAVEMYFTHLEDEEVCDLYQMVMREVEKPLLQAVMRATDGNQSKSALYLGLSRGTLRKKLDEYGLL